MLSLLADQDSFNIKLVVPKVFKCLYQPDHVVVVEIDEFGFVGALFEQAGHLVSAVVKSPPVLCCRFESDFLLNRPAHAKVNKHQAVKGRTEANIVDLDVVVNDVKLV